MGMWAQNNVPRGNRLEQLVDSIANFQTAVIDDANDMKSKHIKQEIDELLKAHGMDTVDDLLNKVRAEMTPRQRKQFDTLINATKKLSTPFQWTSIIVGILMAPGEIIITAKLAISAARFVWNSQIIQKISQFFRAAQDGDTATASAIANEISETVSETSEALEEAGEDVETAAEITETVSVMSKIMSFFEILAVIGLIVQIIASILEAYEEEKQKKELIAHIHKLQPARLNAAFFHEEAKNIDQQLALIEEYAKLAKSDPALAKDLGEAIIQNISAKDSKISLTKLETQLETQDKSSPLYYGGNDLPEEEVVKIARGKKSKD